LIYTYDRKDYILRAVNSVLQQDFDHNKFEIVVVKGFVDSDIDKFLNSYGIKSVYLNDKSLGSKVAKGIQCCKGDVICLLDDDDEFETNKLQTVFKIFDENHNVDFVHNSIVKIDDTGSIIDNSPNENFQNNLYFSPTNYNSDLFSKIIKKRGDWYLSSMCIRKSILNGVLDDLANTNQSVDKFIFFAALNYGKAILMIKDKLTRYRLHESTTTYAGSTADFIRKREIFFMNTVNVFENIVKISENKPGKKYAECQLIQHKINLYFISDKAHSKVSMREFFQFLSCLKITHTRYQLIWICAFLMRRASPGLSRFLYYNFFKIAFENAATV